VTPLLPGSTIGVIGGGQLARMMAFEARRMGLRIAVLDPEPQGPAGQVADAAVQGALDSLDAARELARQSHVVTLDTEHVPAELLEQLEAICPVLPPARVLGIVQDRLQQRRFLRENGLPQPRNAPVSDVRSLRDGAARTGFPCVIKSRRSGYDGRGQARANTADDLEKAWDRIGRAPAVVEQFIDFEREVSALLARDIRGNVRFYPAAENEHRRHILYLSRVPARIPRKLAAEAEAIGETIASALGHVGMMAVELFVTRDQRLLVNEIAPRTHNSGHYTFGACATSQFEQHVRAVAGLPLGDPSLLRPAVMLNLMGELWGETDPEWESVLAHPSARLHLYGKARPFKGRKMGHVLVLDEDAGRAFRTAEEIAEALYSAVDRRRQPAASRSRTS